MNALAARLLGGTLLLLFMLAASGAWILTTAARQFSDELTQRLNGSIAMYVADELPLIRNGRANFEQLARLSRQAMVINPMVEVYLLDPRGRVIGMRDEAVPGATKVPSSPQRIDPATLQAFLSGSNEGPIYGRDPRDPLRPRVFSVAEIRQDEQLQGYVYVILGGERAASLRESLAGSYILRAALGTLFVVLLLAAMAAWGLTAWLTRPIRDLHARALQLGADLGVGTLVHDTRKVGTLEAVRLVFEALATRLHEQLTELRQADRMRRELFTNVSHDLRTPLTAMRGYIDTLAIQGDRMSLQSRQECVAIASRHCDRLNRLVTQIFSLARLDVGAMRLNCEPLSLTELAQDIVRKYQLSAQSRQIRLQLDIDPLAPQIDGDIGFLETVFENLLDNALRHSVPGSEVVVAVRALGDSVRAEVSDRGSGMASTNVARLTQRFVAGAGGRTGLGLAIVSRVLQLHGTELRLVSEVGQGTKASFTLPGRLPVVVGISPARRGQERTALP